MGTKQLLVMLLLIAASAPAEKSASPGAVWRGGMPSGRHFSVSVHGKAEDFVCSGAGSGKALFISEHGDASIQLLLRKNASRLDVRDACSFSSVDYATLQVPSGNYQVYARIPGKPQKAGQSPAPIFFPKLSDACDSAGEATFERFLECSDSWLLEIGQVTTSGAFHKNGRSVRGSAGGEGAGRVLNITELLQWNGYTCDSATDVTGDGEISLSDVGGDLSGDGNIDESDLASYVSTNCTVVQGQWIFRIPDLAADGGSYPDSGSGFVQLRFYPTDTAVFR